MNGKDEQKPEKTKSTDERKRRTGKNERNRRTEQTNIKLQKSVWKTENASAKAPKDGRNRPVSCKTTEIRQSHLACQTLSH